VLNDKGELIYIIHRVEDVTEFVHLKRSGGEHRKLNEELQQLAGRIEAEVYQRARDVAETSRKLKEANAELESFSYTVSHDLRAPLRGLQGFTAALQEDYAAQLPPEAQQYCERIAGAAQRMERLVEDLIDYSRLSRADVQINPVSLQAVIDETLQTCSEEIAKSKALIGRRGEFPSVMAHRPVLIQVLTNLVANALKFVAPGVTPTVSIAAEVRDDRVRVWIEDNGIGVPAEYCARVFNTFERLHGYDTYPGTGIGLAIVKRGMERLGGAAGVEPGHGGGSRFWIELTPA
jgi:signal transduction histidine kinase